MPGRRQVTPAVMNTDRTVNVPPSKSRSRQEYAAVRSVGYRDPHSSDGPQLTAVLRGLLVPHPGQQRRDSPRGKELVSALVKCHYTIAAIRGVPTGVPGPAFPNARLRTDPGNPLTAAGGLRPTSYLQELNRLMVTH